KMTSHSLPASAAWSRRTRIGMLACSLSVGTTTVNSGAMKAAEGTDVEARSMGLIGIRGSRLGFIMNNTGHRPNKPYAESPKVELAMQSGFKLVACWTVRPATCVKTVDETIVRLCHRSRVRDVRHG